MKQFFQILFRNWIFSFFFFFVFLNSSFYFMDPSIIITIVFFLLFFCFLFFIESNVHNLEKPSKILFYFHQFVLIYFKFLKKRKIFLIFLLHRLYKDLLVFFIVYFRELKGFFYHNIWLVFINFCSLCIKKRNMLISYVSSLISYYSLVFLSILLLNENQ